MQRKYLPLAMIFLASFFSASRVDAVTSVGDQLFYTGGNLHIQNLPADSGNDNYIYLRTPFDGDKFLFIDDGNEHITYSQAELSSFGIDIGGELLFVIRPNDQPPEFLTGPASRNPDNLPHALITDIGNGSFLVGFEDLLEGGDFDFNDAQFAVPEPSSLLVFALGLVGLRFRRRARA
jgi:hypothetical protein